MRTAPFTHFDGSNCWTKNCRRNRTPQLLPSTQLLSAKEYTGSELDTERNKQFHAMNKTEKYVTYLFASEDYQWINKELRQPTSLTSGTVSEEEKHFTYTELGNSEYIQDEEDGNIYLFDNGTLPAYRTSSRFQTMVSVMNKITNTRLSQPAIVYRGVPAHIHPDGLTINQNITLTGFVSTSIKPEQALVFMEGAKKNSYMFKLETRKGLCVPAQLETHHEYEIILPKNQTYTITNIEDSFIDEAGTIGDYSQESVKVTMVTLQAQ